MTWLLDVSVLVAYLTTAHEHNQVATHWRADKAIAVCPITELGFLRVSCALGFKLTGARRTLNEFIADENPLFIPCDRHALDGTAVDHPRKTTDVYLADLASLAAIALPR